MEKLPLPILKFLMRKWIPDVEIPFRKLSVIDKLKQIENLDDLLEGRSWEEVQEEVEEEISEEKRRSKELASEKEKRNLEQHLDGFRSECRSLVGQIENKFSDMLEITNRKLSDLEDNIERDKIDNNESWSSLNDRIAKLENSFVHSPSQSIASNIKCNNLPVYDGKGNLEVFLQQINLSAELFRWSKTETASQLALQLRGPAALILRGITGSELRDLNFLETRLRQRFDEFRSYETSRLQFHNCVQYKNESFTEFCHRLEALSLHAYKDVEEELRMSMIRTQFLSGLNNSNIKLKMMTAESALPLKETVARVEGLSEILKMEGHGVCSVDTRKQSFDCVNSKVQFEVQNDSDRMNSRSVRPRSPSPFRRSRDFRDNKGRDIICFNCQRVGHIARYCPLNTPASSSVYSQKAKRSNYQNQTFDESENQKPARAMGIPGAGQN